MTDNGILTAGGPGSWWAWAGASLALAQPPAAPAPPPEPDQPADGTTNTFTGTANHLVQGRDINGDIVFNLGDQHNAPPDLLPWLGALWSSCVDIGATVELRLLNHADRTLSAYLLFRTSSPDQATAIAAATHLRDILPTGLPHLSATPVLAQPILGAALEPFVPHQYGIVEIRKRLTVSRSTRTDTPMPWLAAVTPLAGGNASWEGIWVNLAAFPAPALLSIRLEPFRIGPGLRAHLAEWAGEFARLAVPGPPPNPTWPKPRPADPFARTTKHLFASAVDRYTERAFRIRVSLAASVAMSDDAAQ